MSFLSKTLGDLGKEDLNTVLERSELYEDCRHGVDTNENCKNCEVRYLFGSICKAWAKDKHNIDSGDFDCTARKEILYRNVANKGGGLNVGLYKPIWMKKHILSQEQLSEVDMLFEISDMKTLEKAALHAKNSRVRFAAVKHLKQQIAQKYPEKAEAEHCAMTPGMKDLKENVLLPMLERRSTYFDDPDRVWAATCFSQLYSSNAFYSELHASVSDQDAAVILLLTGAEYMKSVIDSCFDEEWICQIGDVDEYNRISGEWYRGIKPYCTKRLSELSGQKPMK